MGTSDVPVPGVSGHISEMAMPLDERDTVRKQM
jgi:hypothetical protein